MGGVLPMIAVTVFCVGIWLALFLWVPRCMQSVFRYELWQLHDDLTDAMETGALEEGDAADDLLDTLHAAIYHARDFTFANVAGLHAICTVSGVGQVHVPPSYGEVSVDGRRLLHDFERRLVAAVVRHVKWGSPSGWLAMALRPVVMLSFYVGRLFGRAETRPTQMVADAVREELAVKVWSRGDVRDLHACV
jgi:hypothetical protein